MRHGQQREKKKPPGKLQYPTDFHVPRGGERPTVGIRFRRSVNAFSCISRALYNYETPRPRVYGATREVCPSTAHPCVRSDGGGGGFQPIEFQIYLLLKNDKKTKHKKNYGKKKK